MISYRQHQKHVLQAIWNYLDLHPHGIGKQILTKAEKFAGKKNERINNPSKTLDTYVKKNIKARAAWGKVYSFRYNAVYARVLPYYDRYPLVLVLSRNSRRRTFTGLNLHYIPPLYKKQLMHTCLDCGGDGVVDTGERYGGVYLAQSGLAQAVYPKDFQW